MKTHWDKPLFKVLANNDTGAAKGHQGGVVIPQNLRPWFPQLSPTKANGPTVEAKLIADLIVNGKLIGTVDTRYQYQTWGQTRSPESRLTHSLGPLRNHAEGGDILLIQRNLIDPAKYRLTLVKKTGAVFSKWKAKIGSNKSGVVEFADGLSPIAQKDFDKGTAEQLAREDNIFVPIDKEIIKHETRAQKVARSASFRHSVLRQYQNRCAFCGIQLVHESGISVIEGAHVIPRSIGGADDCRNGIALCKNHHWAFDNFVISIDTKRRIVVSLAVASFSENEWLGKLQKKAITEAKSASLRLHELAINWHFKKASTLHEY